MTSFDELRFPQTPLIADLHSPIYSLIRIDDHASVDSLLIAFVVEILEDDVSSIAHSPASPYSVARASVVASGSPIHHSS